LSLGLAAIVFGIIVFLYVHLSRTAKIRISSLIAVILLIGGAAYWISIPEPHMPSLLDL